MLGSIELLEDVAVALMENAIPATEAVKTRSGLRTPNLCDSKMTPIGLEKHQRYGGEETRFDSVSCHARILEKMVQRKEEEMRSKH